MSDKTCFVVMPIGKAGTPEHAHFRAVFTQMKPTIERAGYAAIRADDIQKSGAITRDIVSRLAESDLVIADLTDLNPNVFYELGVRHALRGVGTVMIIDERRSTDIPFDLGSYRVIKYSGDLTGIESLNTALAAFLTDPTDSETSRDNPVHDWFPILPPNVLESASQSSAAPLRRTIKDLQARVAQYEKAFGPLLPQRSQDDSPLSLVMSALADAEDGLVPSKVLEDARMAFEDRNVVALLQKVRVVIERNVRLPANTFLTLAQYAAVLDLDVVVRALFDQAIQLYPSDDNLRRAHLAHLAHSEVPSDRERARADIAEWIGLSVSAKVVTIARPSRIDHDLMFTGILLDAYHSDGLDEDALRIAKTMVETFPQSTKVLRAHARALGRVGRVAEALQEHRASIFAPDVDDTSAAWLGNELHNQDRNALAAEAHAYACTLDPSDPGNFSHLASELSICLSQTGRIEKKRQLPESISADDLLAVAHAAASCGYMDVDSSERLREALERLDLPAQSFDEPMPRSQRVKLVTDIYAALRTDLTRRDAKYDFTAEQRDAGDA
jgi:hypothetical protein